MFHPTLVFNTITTTKYPSANPIATLPKKKLTALLPGDSSHTSFSFPTNYRELFFNRFQPFTPMTLDQAVNVTEDAVFTFTTRRDGLHRFTTEQGVFHVMVFDAALETIVSQGYVWPGRSLTRTLVANTTYHVFVRWIDNAGDLTVTDNVPPPQPQPPQPRPSLWQRITNWFWNIVMSVEGYGNWMSQTLLGRILITPFVALFWIIDFTLWGFPALIDWIRWGGWLW